MRQNTPFSTETQFITWIRRQFSQNSKGVILGIGDDAALVSLPVGKEMILTTDMSIEGVHFKSDFHSPASIGHRALARSLSDVAAMGGTPLNVLISVGLSKNQTQSWLLDVYRGLLKLARRFEVAIIGGDTAVTPGATTLDVMVTGEVQRGQALIRSGARVGDLIYVSGKVGMSALGLRQLLSKAPARSALEKAALRAHLFPEPQCALGQFLSGNRLATAMMDLSDGLSIDLKRLCDASGVGAKLFSDKIPIPALPDRGEALKLGLHGGEDYQLLFTVSPRKAAKIPSHFGKVPLHCIGEIESRKANTLITPDGKSRPLKPLGWDHFARRTKR